MAQDTSGLGLKVYLDNYSIEINFLASDNLRKISHLIWMKSSVTSQAIIFVINSPGGAHFQLRLTNVLSDCM